MQTTPIWTPTLARQAEEALEKATWGKTSEGVLVGRHDRWLFQAFDKGMDPQRTCEVMATFIDSIIIRLPPDLAEKGLKLAKERYG